MEMELGLVWHTGHSDQSAGESNHVWWGRSDLGLVCGRCATKGARSLDGRTFSRGMCRACVPFPFRLSRGPPATHMVPTRQHRLSGRASVGPATTASGRGHGGTRSATTTGRVGLISYTPRARDQVSGPSTPIQVFIVQSSHFRQGFRQREQIGCARPPHFSQRQTLYSALHKSLRIRVGMDH